MCHCYNHLRRTKQYLRKKKLKLTPISTVVLTGTVCGPGSNLASGSSNCSVGSHSEGKESERKTFHLHGGLKNDWRTGRVYIPVSSSDGTRTNAPMWTSFEGIPANHGNFRFLNLHHVRHKIAEQNCGSGSVHQCPIAHRQEAKMNLMLQMVSATGQPNVQHWILELEGDGMEISALRTSRATSCGFEGSVALPAWKKK